MLGFYVRIGSLAEVHAARSGVAVDRGRRVIVRTGRGLELGEVVRACPPQTMIDPSAPRIVRPTTGEDELLIRRLLRHKRDAVEACRKALAESGSQSTLLDVDQLFDGGTLLMHFLGPVDEIAQAVTRQVAEQYEAVVRTHHFSKLLHEGCGPDCGSGAGCGTGAGCGSQCSGCAAAVNRGHSAHPTA